MPYVCAAGVNAQQSVSRDETQYLHGDMIDSTMLATDERGSDLLGSFAKVLRCQLRARRGPGAASGSGQTGRTRGPL